MADETKAKATTSEAKKTGPLVKATDAETQKVREAWAAGEQIPSGFYVNFEQQGGETVLNVRKRS